MTAPLASPVSAAAVPDLQFLVDRTGRILECNASPQRVLRIPQERMVGHVAEEFLPAAAAQALQAGLARTLAEGLQPGILFSVPFPDGERHYEAFIVPLFGPPAPAERLAVIVCDVTDRKQTEAALRDSHELLALLIRNSPIYAYVKKVTPTESVVVHASENFRQMIGIPGSEMVGKNMAALFPADLAAKMTADDWNIVSTGEVQAFEEELNGRIYATVKYPIIQGGQTLLAGYSQDITERKQVEMALRASEAKYRLLFQSLRDAFVSVDMDGHILEHNSVYEELTGYSSAELRHLTYVDLTPEKWRASEAKIVAEQVLPRGFSEVYEKEYRRKDGTPVPIELRTILIRDASGQPAGMWATIRDISERKRADRFLRLVLDNVPNAVSWKDRNSVFLGCNQAVAKAAGLDSPEQIVGKTDYDLGWKKEESDLFVAMDRQVMESDRAQYHIIEPQRQADGKQAWLDTCKIPLHDEQGRVIGILGAFEDITERLRMERELKSHAVDLERRVQARTAELEASRAALEKNEALFRQMAEGIQEVFWLFEVQTQKALFISPSFERVWGRSRADVSRNMSAWLACIQPEDQARVRRRFEQVMVSGEFGPIQYRIVHPDGTVRWLEDRAWAIRDGQGSVYRVAGVSRDITEHRRLESEVLKASEAERQRIGRDLHDGLSQALTAIGYLADAVHGSLASASRPEAADVRKMMEWIAKTGQQAHAMAQGLLLTDLKRGGLLPALQELALATGEFFGVACRYRGPVAVTLPSVEVAQQLYRIAQEAATNAAKHSKGKTIDIRLAKTRAGLRLTIRDDGQGLPEVQGARAGLGLEIMQYRAGLIGATLSIESAPGRGTRVTCLIPRAADPPRKAKP